MSAEIHFTNRQQPKAVTTQTSAAVAAHYEAMLAAPKAQIADLKAQLAEVKARIADVSAALNSGGKRRPPSRSLEKPWRNNDCSQGHRHGN